MSIEVTAEEIAAENAGPGAFDCRAAMLTPTAASDCAAGK
jgi:hypothetical protein